MSRDAGDGRGGPRAGRAGQSTVAGDGRATWRGALPVRKMEKRHALCPQTPPAMPYRVSLIFLVAVLAGKRGRGKEGAIDARGGMRCAGGVADGWRIVLQAGLGAQAVQAKVHQQPDVVQKASKPGNASELWDDSAANNFIGVAVSERVNTLAASGDERLLAMSTVTFLPHPGGTAKSDAWFLVTPDEGVAFGLADAGGGTSDAYAKELMQQSEVLSSKHMCWESMSTRELLREAHAQTKTKGSSTATMGMICGNRLQIAALGDAGVVVVRDGKVVLVTASQQHGFQQPLQVSSCVEFAVCPQSDPQIDACM